MQIIKENPVTLNIILDDVVSVLEINKNQITDVAFYVKENATDTDANAKIVKKLGNGIIYDHEHYHIYFAKEDTQNLVVGKTYYAAIGIKYGNLQNFLELELEDNVFSVTQDYIRE